MVALKTSFQPASPRNKPIFHRSKSDPYGKVTVLDASGNPKADPNNSEYGNPWTFTGRRLDGETGLLYYRNRMYETGLGRFIERDPIGYVDGMGLYRGYFVPHGVDPYGEKVYLEYLDPKDKVAQYPYKFTEADFQKMKALFPYNPPTRPATTGSAIGGTYGQTRLDFVARSNTKIKCRKRAIPYVDVLTICGCWECSLENIDFSGKIFSFGHYKSKDDTVYKHEMVHVRILEAGFYSIFNSLEAHLLATKAYGFTYTGTKERLENYIAATFKEADQRLYKARLLSASFDNPFVGGRTDLDARLAYYGPSTLVGEAAGLGSAPWGQWSVCVKRP